MRDTLDPKVWRRQPMDTVDAAARRAYSSDPPPLFSVVTAVRNGAKTLAATIESVSRQTFRDFEYIVIDGASTDATVSIIEQWSSSISRWTSERDSGLYDAWNKALALARGQWVAFLGADDVYCEDALEQYARAIAALPDQGPQYISSRVQLVKDGRSIRTVGSAWSWPAFSHHMTVAHVGSMHHRSLFQQYGGFDDSYGICGDYELLLRPRGRLRAAFLDKVTVRMAVGGISNTALALAEQERAKRTTGGRATFLCALERRSAYLRSRCRQLLWY
jgi:glycosyltransferase involved in cell wall biosynthesis